MHLTYQIICNYYCIASICVSGLAIEKEAIGENKKSNPTSIFVVVFLFVCLFSIFGETSMYHRNGYSTTITTLSGMFMAQMQFPCADYFLWFLQDCHFMIPQKISPVLMAHLLFHSFLWMTIFVTAQMEVMNQVKFAMQGWRLTFTLTCSLAKAGWICEQETNNNNFLSRVEEWVLNASIKRLQSMLGLFDWTKKQWWWLTSWVGFVNGCSAQANNTCMVCDRISDVDCTFTRFVISDNDSN